MRRLAPNASAGVVEVGDPLAMARIVRCEIALDATDAAVLGPCGTTLFASATVVDITVRRAVPGITVARLNPILDRPRH
jgi:hypothetical protein